MYWFDLMWGNHSRGNGYIGMVEWGEPQSKPGGIHRSNMILVDPTDCEIMQFTGLKDKDGKEIYEGDIIKGSAPYPKEVKWIGHFNYAGWNIGAGHDGRMHYEIIGNIYEHPELLSPSQLNQPSK